MNTQFKVGQKVRVITGANVVYFDMFNNMEGVIIDIARNNTPDVFIYVDFQNGYKIWCYTQKDRGITLNVEILQDDTDKPVMWRKIDPNNLCTENVVAIDNDHTPKQVVKGTLELTEDDRIRLYIGNGSYMYRFTHYIPLSELISLPIE
jgi:hypothetical protein